MVKWLDGMWMERAPTQGCPYEGSFILISLGRARGKANAKAKEKSKEKEKAAAVRATLCGRPLPIKKIALFPSPLLSIFFTKSGKIK